MGRRAAKSKVNQQIALPPRDKIEPVVAKRGYKNRRGVANPIANRGTSIPPDRTISKEPQHRISKKSSKVKFDRSNLQTMDQLTAIFYN
jgi:hypothetical protein